MIRRTFAMRLKPGALAEYKRRHDEIWPELVDEIKRSGIRKMTTVLDGDTLILFSEIESEDAAAASTPEELAATAQTEAAVSDTETELDEAVLDMIALEMAAPDFDEPVGVETYAVETASVEPDIAAQAPEIVIASEPKSAPPPQPSLGASLIANGIVRRPDTPAVDPLAPIRRMSQAEKIAFFS